MTGEQKWEEVFAAVTLDSSLEEAVRGAVITRMVLHDGRSVLTVCVRFPHLVSKRDINRLEGEIKKQYFRHKDVRIELAESFELEKPLSAEDVFEEYRGSLSMELHQQSPVLLQLFLHADYAFSEGSLQITLPAGMVNQRRGKELADFLQRVFTDRFGLSVKVTLAYSDDMPEKEVSRPETESFEEPLLSAEEPAGPAEPLPWEPEPAAEAYETAAPAPAAPRRNRPVKAQTYRRKGNKEGLVYGRGITGKPLPMSEIVEEMGDVTVQGRIFRIDNSRQMKNGKFLVVMDITDETDSISLKLFLEEEKMNDLLEQIQKGDWIEVEGTTQVDTYEHELMISRVSGIRKISRVEEVRMDHAEVKRVELHCHTKMSEMDAVSSVTALLGRAKLWGHPAMAITDHGNVQAFTEAYKKYGSDESIKIIYGLEGYLVDDLISAVHGGSDETLDGSFVVFDIETTGLSRESDEIIEIGAVKIAGGEIAGRFSAFVKPVQKVSGKIEELTHITNAMLEGERRLAEVLPEFIEFAAGSVLVAHNAAFDTGFITRDCRALGLPCPEVWMDTLALARLMLPNLKRYNLDALTKEFHVRLSQHHRAVDDAEATAEIFLQMQVMLRQKGIKTLTDINLLGSPSPEVIKKLPTYHIILLAANETGRVHLYELVSRSHLDYFQRRPRIPKSLLNELREGIIIGSACEAGELFHAVEDGASAEELEKIGSFYDYFEIQPIGNNEFMLRDEKRNAETVEDLKNLNRKIVALGERMGKPVAATCDVHFLDPSDEIYRRIIMKGQGFPDADEQPPLYLRTTEEMLEEFEYLGEEKAYEVVVTNTNLIADRIERIAPVRPDKCPPVIPDSDRILTDLCYETARGMYGDPLPKQVDERLTRELHSIISNGFAVMYIIAQKLVKKSNEDGYLVGSRGSVGSSLVATMAGITEVNPLSPHYYCPSCHYSDFESDEVKAYAGRAGCDMPDKVCPVCGAQLKKDGFDIPFETFLGFNGDKEPDIDLNFSGEYQNQAHDYTEVIFGKGHTFRAGTIGTMAEKTAYGFVKHYFEEQGLVKRSCEINRLVEGCAGVKRSTGQHPGGIVVMPHGENIYSFTPIQHPANDPAKPVTTHFDYHAIDHNLLKLDILGHDDPTMIRALQDLTGVDPKSIPLDDKKVMSLFWNTEALGITPEAIGGVPLGTLGVPEFGTSFAMQMLIEAGPKGFSDLVRIAGLAHGTDVWTGNAQDLIKSGTATIASAICTRDDIMIYLIEQGVESSLAFTIMEAVRKGKGLKPDWEEAMRAQNVPEWYIESCKKIKYMFPKAHAAAYVMMAWRIAWFKIYYPQEYYAAYFGIRAKAFSYELMCQGAEKAVKQLEYFSRFNEKALTQNEQETIRTLKSVREMYARGFTFVPLDLYKAKARHFQVTGDGIMPALNTIDGLGDKAAEAIEAEAAKGKFLSVEDFVSRTKVSSTLAEQMRAMGLFEGIPATNQISLFDLEPELEL